MGIVLVILTIFSLNISSFAFQVPRPSLSIFLGVSVSVGTPTLLFDTALRLIVFPTNNLVLLLSWNVETSNHALGGGILCPSFVASTFPKFHQTLATLKYVLCIVVVAFHLKSRHFPFIIGGMPRLERLYD